MNAEPENPEEVELSRRYSDHIKNRSDRELLIGHSKDIKLICKKLDDREKKREDFEIRIYDKMDKWTTNVDLKCESRLGMMNSKMGSSTFKWFFGLMATVMILMAGTVSFNRVDLAETKANLKETGIHLQETSDLVKKNTKIIHSNARAIKDICPE
jgi:hypothetical protein